jgi:hypothetical protein
VKIAGRLDLLHDGRVPAVLREFELDGDALEFTLEVPLSVPLLDGLGEPQWPSLGPPSSPPDAVLRVSWARDLADEVALRIPARGQAIVHARALSEQPPGQPELAPVRCSLEGSSWQQRLTFQPLPEIGELTFRLSSRLLDIRTAVGVVPVANLRSRLI